MKKDIRYLVLSDIHLGHKRNKKEDIIQNLDRFFDMYRNRTDIDILFLAGDVFDRELDFHGDEVAEIVPWVARLLEFCSFKKIKLRVLEGTPSHDWRQSRIFETLFKSSNLDLDVKYIDTLYVEVFDEWDFSVLYIPDEWTSSTEKAYQQAVAAIHSQHLAQVDIAIMHGSFGYQLPSAAIHAPRHNEHDYLSIVRHFISIGHVHNFSVFERIIAQGSFDRLSHGEEEPKGGVECFIQKDGTREFWFIENKHAKLFKTLVLKSKNIDDSITFISKKTKALPYHSYVRIKAPKDHPAMVGFEELKKRFPDLILSKLNLEDDVEIQSDLIAEVCSDESKYTPITITSANIESLLFEEIRVKYTLTEAQWELTQKALSQVL